MTRSGRNALANNNRKQKALTVVLVTAIIIGCVLIGWLLKTKKTFSVANPDLPFDTTPSFEFKNAIGGDGSKDPYRMSEPMGVDIGSDDNIYVADTLDSVIKVFDSDGKYITTFGKGQMYMPTDVKVFGRQVFVVDGKNSRIQLFDMNGKFLKTFAGPEIGKKIGAWIPVALDISKSGRVYVTDVFYQRVVVFDKNGQVVKRFGVPGSGKGQLLYPNGIAVDEGRKIVYVADSNNGRVEVFDTNGKCLGTLTTGNQSLGQEMPRGMTLAGKWLIVSETFGHHLGLYMVDKAKASAAEQLGTRGVGDAEMNFPNDVAFNNGMLCIADRANNRILVYSEN